MEKTEIKDENFNENDYVEMAAIRELIGISSDDEIIEAFKIPGQHPNPVQKGIKTRSGEFFSYKMDYIIVW